MVGEIFYVECKIDVWYCFVGFKNCMCIKICYVLIKVVSYFFVVNECLNEMN